MKDKEMEQALANLDVTAGSLQDVADQTGVDLAAALFGAEVIVAVDMSSSMAATDAPLAEEQKQSRYDAAEQELRDLQAEYPGKVGVVGFSSQVFFHPNGVPYRQMGSTNLTAALEYVLQFDGLYKIVFISDGQPNSRTRALEMARKFTLPIDVIYVGPADDNRGGWKYLEQLAKATGGSFMITSEPGLLGEGVRPLLMTQDENSQGVISL